MIDTWYTPENMNQACEHGHQRRKCPHCESIWQDERIAELEQELAGAKAEWGSYEEDIAELKHENSTLHRMLAANPDVATSTGASQAAMEYEIKIRDKRNTELEQKAGAERMETARVRAALATRDKEYQLEHDLRVELEQIEESQQAIIKEQDTKLAELEAGNLCTVCTGNPISPYPCICGGSGTVQGEAQGLRELVAELELQVKKCQRLRGALESIQTNPDYTAPEYMVRIARKALEES